MPELTLDVGLIADTTNPEQLLVRLDPATTVTPGDIAGLESSANKGVPGGYAPLGADNLVPAEFLPESTGGGGGTPANMPFYDIRDYGALVGNANNQTAIQAAINAAEAAGGGRVFVPQGVWNTGPLVLGNRVWLEGASMRGSRLVLVGSTNADFITNKVSADGISANAQFVGVLNLTLDGNLANNLTSGRGIYFTQNPTFGKTTGDDFVDPRMLVRDVLITNVRGNAFENVGRSEITLHNVNVFFCGGHGFVPGPDTFLNSCKTGATGRAGFYLASSSIRLSNCKAFYAGDSNFGTPTDGHGFHVNNSGRGVTLSNCEAQDCKGAGLRIANSAHRTIVEGFVADSNSKQGRGLYAGIEIGASRHCVISAVCFERNDPALPTGDANFCPQRYALKLESSAQFNKIRLTHSATSGTGHAVDEPIMPSSNTTALLSQNDVSINGQDGYRSMNFSSSWIPEVYSGSTISMTLTGNTTLQNTGSTATNAAHPGSKLEIVFTQDATGGRTVSFGSMYRVSGSVDTTANAVSVVRLTYNGFVWAGAWERNEAAAGGGVRRYKPGQYYGSFGNEFNTNQRAPGNFVAVPFEVHEAMPIDRIGFNITTSSAGNTRLGIYADDDGYPGARLLDAGVISTGTTGSREITISYTLQPGFYWLVSNTESGSATFRSHLGINPLMPVLPASVTLVNGYEAAGVASGSLPATAPADMLLIGAATRVVVRAA